MIRAQQARCGAGRRLPLSGILENRGEEQFANERARAASDNVVFACADVAIFHDHFSIRGGGERLVLTLAEAFNSDLYYGYATAASYEAAMFPRVAVDLGLPAGLRRSGVRPLALAAVFARQRTRAASYQTRIFSGVTAPFAAPARTVGTKNILYCHTPPRFLFDKREHFLSRLNAPARLMATPALLKFEHAYRKAIDRMDVIIANSENIRQRIRTYLGRDSVVVYPPCPTGSFVWSGQCDYYLSTARLDSLKRVDLIVDAFLRQPDKRLIVVSDGEQRAMLRSRASGAANIEFLGWVGEDKLRELVGGAIATIYVPRDEDFGMSPVESMAAGKPVIGVNEGGLAETIVDGRTGILLRPDFSTDDLVDAVRWLTPHRALAMRAACEERAQLFTSDRFVASMAEWVSIRAGAG